ncbi:MAG TPA: GNAT family N-acetyltransferase [Acidimicrobiales bacterium]|nr:GNAT family N-acetyltransferase [Acidimicrobiales bacterium]
MSRPAGRTTGAAPDGRAGARGDAGAEGGVVVRVERYDGPTAQSLVAAMVVDIEERYAADGEAGDAEGEWALGVDQVSPPRGVFLVAYHDGRPVGCGALRPLPAAGAHVAEIKRMYTSPSARRRGVGRAVLARLESEAVGLGYRRLHLETGLRQPEAIALYEASGYHRIPNYGMYAASELSACYGKDVNAR